MVTVPGKIETGERSNEGEEGRTVPDPVVVVFFVVERDSQAVRAQSGGPCVESLIVIVIRIDRHARTGSVYCVCRLDVLGIE